MRLLSLCFLFLSLSLLTSVIILLYIPERWISGRNQLLLISMDGFRHDYIEKVKASGGKTPNFDYLISEGTRIMRMKNAFPTITLPNHQTIITGLYPENHGIVLNTFKDKNIPSETFDMNNQDNLNDPKWFKNWPEPIWVTLQKAGHLTGSHLWPLTDAPIDGQLPFFQESQYTLLDNPPIIFPFMKRVEDVVNWFSNSQVHIDFVMLYFPEPDEIGHSYGPNDKHVFDVIMNLDSVMGHLISLLKAKGLWDKVDIIITADHGMSEDSGTREIPLDEYVDPSWYTYTLLTPVGTLYPVQGKEQAVYDALKNKNPHLEVYWRHEVPASLNYNIDNGRIAPLILIAENRWAITHNRSNSTGVYGNHGYNNSEPDVQPFFIAQGPDFRRNFTLPIGNSVDTYPLMCHLMGIKPNPNNGSLKNIQNILAPASKCRFSNGLIFLRKYYWIALGCLGILFISMLIVLITCEALRSKKGKSLKFNSKNPYSKLGYV